jgi:LacI family transcriptional regulator, galactose operon repressor
LGGRAGYLKQTTTKDRLAQAATIRDVAAHAGVSLGTVSNALNQPELVARDTLARVMEAVSALGYVRNASASQLRSGKAIGIGLVVLDVANPFFTEVARGVEDVANDAGFLVTLCSSDGSTDRENRYLGLLEEQRIGGVLITPAERKPPLAVERLRSRGTPVVLLDRSARGASHCAVAVDDVHGARIAARHLLEFGHRDLALINGPLGLVQCADRRRGFVAMTKTVEDASVVEATTEAMNSVAGERAIRETLEKGHRPTAVFCANDMLALGVMRALLAEGIRIPEDIALIGYDDVAFASLAHVPLTSVRQPTYQLGRTAAELLLAEIEETGDHDHRNVSFKPELVVRESTAG